MTIGRSQIPYRAFLKLFCTWDKRAKLLRCGRLVWAKGKPGGLAAGGDGGYSAKLSLALTPRLVGFSRDWNEFFVTLFGVRIHYQRSYGSWDV